MGDVLVFRETRTARQSELVKLVASFELPERR
jgi:hypothetical protein